MKIVVFGATGKLGSHVLKSLVKRPVDVLAAGRDLSKLPNHDIPTVRVDYADAESVRTALRGADRALLISGSTPGLRRAQHATVIEAAVEAGLGLLAYTSTPHATESPMTMAEDHAATETLLRKSDVPHAILRNSMYLENLTEQTAPQAVATGVIPGASGEGRISPASRTDLADAAAEVLTGEGHAGAVYELGGERSYTMAEVAAAIADWSGKPVRYEDVSVPAFKDLLVGQGVPVMLADVFADTQAGIARGEFLVESGDLVRLIGRPSRSLEDALGSAA
jgi:NAD(P)H dehydrogenase (quinone)